MSRPTKQAMTLLCVLVAVLPSVFAAPSQASKSQITIFDAPRDLKDPATRPAALQELESLGVKHLRLVVYWKDVAPQPDSRTRPNFDATDPATYDWGQYEPIVAEAAARGWGVVLTPSGPVPRWATNGAVDQKTRPSPNEFRKFVTALVKQFGSRVTAWSIWNEPNHPDFLLPQYDSAKKPASPAIYRKLYAAAIRGLENGGDDATPVLFGEVAPVGTSKVVSPLEFLRGGLCLNATGTKKKTPDCQKLRVGGIAIHPYTRKTGPYFRPGKKDDVTIGVLDRAVTFVQRAERAGVLDRNTKLHLTEFGIQSLPDTLVGVSQQRQEEFRAMSEKIAWDEPRVATFSQYLLTDDDSNPSAPPVARYPGFESGLKLASGGRPKQSFDGFRLPVVARANGGDRVALWGLIRPGAGKRTGELQKRSGSSGTWSKVETLATSEDGYWSYATTASKGTQFRVVWETFTGAATRITAKP